MRKYRVAVSLPGEEVQKVTIEAEDAADARSKIKQQFNAEGKQVKLRSYGEIEQQRLANKKYLAKPGAQEKARYRVRKSHAKKFVEVSSDEDLEQLFAMIQEEMEKRGIDYS